MKELFEGCRNRYNETMNKYVENYLDYGNSFMDCQKAADYIVENVGTLEDCFTYPKDFHDT